MQSLALKNEKDDRYRDTMCCRIISSFAKDSNTLRLDNLAVSLITAA